MNRCKKCKSQMTFANQRKQFGRLCSAGIAVDRVKQILPRCQMCVTLWLKEDRETNRLIDKAMLADGQELTL